MFDWFKQAFTSLVESLTLICRSIGRVVDSVMSVHLFLISGVLGAVAAFFPDLTQVFREVVSKLAPPSFSIPAEITTFLPSGISYFLSNAIPWDALQSLFQECLGIIAVSVGLRVGCFVVRVLLSVL